MTPQPLALPLRGIDNRSELTALSAGAVRMAQNLRLRPDGRFGRRVGYSTLVPGEGFHSVHADAWGVLIGRGDELLALDVQQATLTPLYHTGADAPLSFAAYNGKTYILTARELLVRDAAGVRPAGLDGPRMLPALEGAAGAMPTGRYGVAVSVVADDGEESGAAWVGSAAVGAGLRLRGLDPSARHRVYLTTADGDALYHAADAHGAEVHLTGLPAGAPCESLHLQRLPGGHIVRARAGRMYVAVGNTLCFSRPLRPHLFDPRADFVVFSGEIALLQPVQAGLFVGDDRGVWFLAGDDPSTARLVQADGTLAFKGSGMSIAADAVGMQSTAEAALWLGPDGYTVGAPDGSIKRLQEGRVALRSGLIGASAAFERDGFTQVVTATAAYRPLDSPRAARDFPVGSSHP